MRKVALVVLTRGEKQHRNAFRLKFGFGVLYHDILSNQHLYNLTVSCNTPNKVETAQIRTRDN